MVVVATGRACRPAVRVAGGGEVVSKCENCGGFGWYDVDDDGNPRLDLTCEVCKGTGWINAPVTRPQGEK